MERKLLKKEVNIITGNGLNGSSANYLLNEDGNILCDLCVTFVTFAVNNFFLTAKYAEFNAEFAKLMFPLSFAIFA